MRPRPDAAENTLCLFRRRGDPHGFNEAAARCRGKRTLDEPGVEEHVAASMRPRPDAAENLADQTGAIPRLLLQ